jgi:glycosyltransferase involved in cell wall biosynthesis
MSPRPLRFIFISGNREWGGSEELWSAAAATLAADGHHVSVFKSRVPEAEPRIQRLRELGVPIHDLARFPLMPRRFWREMNRVSYQAALVHEIARLRVGLGASRRPDLVVVSQGGNYDGYVFAEVCRRMRLPYVIVSQKASDLYWPTDANRASVRGAFEAAHASYFVAEHNLRLTEEQLGIALPHASVVRNPFLVPWERRHDWPDESKGLRLACVGRLYPKEKGQDLLLRVLARDRWRSRDVSLTFFGSGAHRQGLAEMARSLGLRNVTFGGFVRDVATIWDDHHALVLPSRCEGLPLVLVEAMLSGRVPIVTDSGGSAEVIEDDVTGFVVAAAAEDSLDAAMERAWNRRAEWRAIGDAASFRIRELVPEDPAAVFAAQLVRDSRASE